MATFRYDPYLWVHLAGIATVPLWLALCGLGLAAGMPTFPGVEQGAIITLGVIPVVLMQLLRPFCIFSLMALALKPSSLTIAQRQMLSLFRRWRVRLWAVVVPVPLVWLLLQLYPQAIVMSDLTPFAEWGRFGGVAIAGASFLMANLFLQVPISTLAVMATGDRTFASTSPYPIDRVGQDFTQIGLPLNQILPTVLPPVAVAPTQADRAKTAIGANAADVDVSDEEALGQGPSTAAHNSATSEDLPVFPFTPAEAIEPDASTLGHPMPQPSHPEIADCETHQMPLEVEVVGISGQRFPPIQSDGNKDE